MSVESLTNLIQQIPLSKLREHPKNPRIALRQDVVDAIAANIGDAFDPAHALIVRPVDDYYEIISGHHRKAAAEKVALGSVPCWVREMSDDEAYMALATSNSQGELSPLEIGLHALNCVALSEGGRGVKGGLRQYAALLGKAESYIRQARQAANVALNCAVNCAVLQDKMQHLSAVHALPKNCWQEAVEVILKNDWSAKETAERVKSAKDFKTHNRIIGIFGGKTSQNELDRIDRIYESVLSSLQYGDTKQAWEKWFADNDPIDVKEVQDKRIELEDIEWERSDQDKSPLPQLILADPPWRYEFSKSDTRQIENQYPSATIEEIISHEPETANDAVLFLWATVAKLKEALDVMDAWGFDYKTHAVWDKEKIGMGYWFRGQHELLLVGTKGNISPPEAEQRVSSVFREARGQHSEKPNCVYEWIESAFPNLVKLEMYCRNPREGWYVFGNESQGREAA